jgi:uncharacterized damage-inducible protein DinB
MLSKSQREEYLRQMEELPQILEAAVANLNDKQLDTSYREGGWTVRQVVHHLADAHMNGYLRVKLILTENHPTLKTYDQNEWAKLADVFTMPVEASLSILRGLHKRWVALLRSIPEGSWSRTAAHPERGEMSLDDMLPLYAQHGVKHVEQIRGLRARQGW